MTLAREWYPAAAHSGRRGAAVRLLVVHVTGADNYRALGEWYARPEASVSLHVGIDDWDPAGRVGEYVRPQEAAWANRSYNPEALTAGLCVPDAALRWPTSRWLARRVLLANLAAWMAEEVGVPLVRLTPEEARGGAAGVCQHGDLVNDHRTAPGLPLDRVLADAQEMRTP